MNVMASERKTHSMTKYHHEERSDVVISVNPYYVLHDRDTHAFAGIKERMARVWVAAPTPAYASFTF